MAHIKKRYLGWTWAVLKMYSESHLDHFPPHFDFEKTKIKLKESGI